MKTIVSRNGHFTQVGTASKKTFGSDATDIFPEQDKTDPVSL